MSDLLREVLRYLGQGGAVMLPLALGTVALWYAVGYRAWLLRPSGRLDLRALLRRALEGAPPRGPLGEAAAAVVAVPRGASSRAQRLDAALSPLQDGLGRGAALARTVVMVAPLLGLLGTVSGMIEMFDSLGSGTFFAQEGGIARGIAQALFTTQMGLAVAIPGLFAARVLERREARLRHQLDQLKQAALTGEVLS